ncbi:MFS transporter [Aestuariibius sp. 2305UL40-4]|uniref:MFS transporter n=1 Tax=Aestuariibius violaceus TaxID=3234132 RepID=UPI00345F0B28
MTETAAPTAGTRSIIAILSTSNFVIGMGAFVVIGMLEPLSDDLGITPAEAGWLMTIYALAYAVFSPILVSLTGRIGRRRILAAALGIFATASLLGAMAPDPITLNATRILAAAGAGLFTPNTAAVAALLSAPEARGKALAAVFMGLTLAQVAGVPAGSFIAYTFGWRLALLLVAVLALPCLWLIWTRVPAGLAFQPSRLSDLARTLRHGPTMLAVLFTTSFLAAIYVLFTYIAPLLTAQMGYGRNGITLILVVFGLGAVVGNLGGGWLADRIGAVRTLTLLATAQILIMPVFSILPIATPALIALAFTWSVAGWSFMAGQQLRLISLAPAEANVVLALNAAAIYVGAALGSAAGGAVLATFGPGALGLAAGAMAILALIHITVSARLSGTAPS